MTSDLHTSLYGLPTVSYLRSLRRSPGVGGLTGSAMLPSRNERATSSPTSRSRPHSRSSSSASLLASCCTRRSMRVLRRGVDVGGFHDETDTDCERSRLGSAGASESESESGSRMRLRGVVCGACGAG